MNVLLTPVETRRHAVTVAASSAEPSAGTIAELLGETLWHYQDEAPQFNVSA